MLALALSAICFVFTSVVKADFSQIVYANDSSIQYTSGSPTCSLYQTQVWTSYSNPAPCTPVEWDGGLWTGGAIPVIDFQQAVGDKADGGVLPITFSFTFTGTEFNVIGNDWRDGLVTFTLDGQSESPYDLGKATNITGARCRFPWYTRTGLAPVQHTFEFNLTQPSAFVTPEGGTEISGANTYFGIQFFYYSYTPVSMPASTSSTSAASITSATSQATHHKSNTAAIGAGVGVGVVLLIAIALVLYFCLRTRRRQDDSVDNLRGQGSALPHQQPYHPSSMVAMQTGQSFAANPQYYVQQPPHNPQGPFSPTGVQQYSDLPATQAYPYVIPTMSRSPTYEDGQDLASKSSNSARSPATSPRPASSESLSSSARPQSMTALSDTDIRRVAQMVVGMLPQSGAEQTSRPLPAPPPNYHES